MTDEEVRTKVMEHDALIVQMDARLDAIERRLLALESRVSSGATVVWAGIGLALLMTVYELF